MTAEAEGKDSRFAIPSDSRGSQRQGSQSSGGQERNGGREPDVQADRNLDERRRKIAESAYYRAERRGFAPGSEDGDWVEAEKEIGEWLGSIKVEELNKCLRNELSAIETYQQALDKNRTRDAHDAKFEILVRILNDHQDAAARLRAIIEQQCGTASSDSGAWGAWSKTVMAAAKLFGDKAALKALKEGEQSGLNEYQRIAQHAGASTENVVSSFVARQQAHIAELERLIEAA